MNTKNIIFVISILTILMTGCVNKENIEMTKNSKVETERETKLSKLYDWDQAMIKIVDDYPSF